METMTESHWMLNGKPRLLDRNEVSYDDICEMVYGRRGIHPTVTFDRAAQEKREGILIAGQSVRLGPKTRIECIFTNCA